MKICVSIDEKIKKILEPLLTLTLEKFKGQVELKYNNFTSTTECDFAIIYKLDSAINPKCHYIEIIDQDSYTGDLVRHRYINQFKVKAFFVKEQLTRDPDELAGLTGIVKDEIRRFIVSDEGEKSSKNIKSIGWKKPKGEDASSSAAQFMTILWDPKMQDFLSELSFYLHRQNYDVLSKAVIESGKVNALFRDISRGVHDKDDLEDFKANDIFKKLTGALTKETEFKTQHIIIEGESGSGKSMLAELIHEIVKGVANKPKMPFQIVSAANLSPQLINLELFGSISGAFTGAEASTGQCALARGGILFIDELGCLPEEAQAKLLLYLDKFKFTPMCWPFPEQVVSPALVIAATNADLPKMIAEGSFRSDLYQRFRIRMRVPALRERMRNFRLLVDIVLQNPIVNPNVKDKDEKDQEKDNSIQKITITALKKLEKHSFKDGNFRELETILSRAVVRAQLDGSKVILAEHITF